MSEAEDAFAPFAGRMRREGLPELAIASFRYYYEQVARGSTGLIGEDEIEPVDSLPDSESLDADLVEVGNAVLGKTVLMKLNGGLGTSMGLDRAKSLLAVKNDLAFLDIIARQALEAGTPLLLMNSFNTRAESLARLHMYPRLEHQEVPLDFLQHKVPKIRQEDLGPANRPDDPELEWCPPGHGDIYLALATSGTLHILLEHGYEYAFVANADNLGAVLDLRILGYFADQEFPFMMEVADRTAADRKGGHLAQLPDGRLILRESAQCPEEDLDAFQDIERHRYFNTNNLWLHLPSLAAKLEERDYILELPMVRNEKTVDPRDSESAPVFQLETAMGSAIGVFESAGAVRVPRSRFAPVKTTNDLLAVRSDAYVLTDDYRLVLNPDREDVDLLVDLDRDYYELIDEMEARFPYGPPSLVDCRRFVVEGDICFGREIVARGSVHLSNQHDYQVAVADHEVLSGERQL